MIETIYTVDARLLGIVPNAGQDISVAFQAAVNNLSSGGGKLGTSLQLAPGTYFFRNDAQISVPDGITIDGAGNDTILQLGAEAPGANHTIFIVPDAATVIFKNLNFKGPVVAAFTVRAIDKVGTSGGITLLNITATNPTHAIVRVASGCVFALEDCAEIGVDFLTEASTQSWTHFGNGLWTGGSLQRQIKGTVDPSAGAGVAAPEGSIFQRFVAGAGELWVKTAALDTDWTNISGGGGGGGSSILYWGNSDVGAAADTRFLTPGRGDVTAPLTNIYDIVSPRAGTLQNFRIRHNSAGGDGDPVVYTVLVNGVATAITVSLVTGAVGNGSDLVNTAVVVAGDRIAVRASKAAGITSGIVDVMAALEFVS